MTIHAGNKKDAQPFVCGVCGRRAWAIGYVKKHGDSIMWLCRDPECIEVASEVYEMKPKDLDRYEETAVSTAKQKSVDPLFEAMLGSLWKSGVRSLDDMNAEAFAKSVKAALDGPELQRALIGFLQEYSASIKKQLTDGAAPF